MSVHICRTEMQEVHRENVGVRWCFACRTRTAFVYVVLDTVDPSYFDPVRMVKCGNCGQTDGDCGFGRCREWT